MKILITGATGYIGHLLAKEAAAKDYTVHVLVRDIHSLSLPKHINIVPFKGDITDKQSVATAMAGCSRVIHTAAIAKLWVKDKGDFLKVNVEGTRNILDAAYNSGVKKLVFTSSAGVLGPSLHFKPLCEKDPRITTFSNDYELSKYIAEELVKEYAHKGLFSVIVSPSRVYGPCMGTDSNAINHLINQILHQPLAFVPADTTVTDNYVFIDDVVKGHFLALDKGLSGDTYLLGGENVSYGTFFETIRAAAHRKVRFIPVPKMLMKGWASVYAAGCTIIGKHTHLTPKMIDRLLQNRTLNCKKAITQLGYTITPFREGVSKTIQHLKNNTYA